MHLLNKKFSSCTLFLRIFRLPTLLPRVCLFLFLIVTDLLCLVHVYNSSCPCHKLASYFVCLLSCYSHPIVCLALYSVHLTLLCGHTCRVSISRPLFCVLAVMLHIPRLLLISCSAYQKFVLTRWSEYPCRVGIMIVSLVHFPFDFSVY